MFAASALKPFVREESLPGAHVQSDDELLDYARRNASTCHHASCTCMMGSHAIAVVDDELKVHGLDGLRVIDASVMPAVTSTNTNARTIMIAEKAPRLQKPANDGLAKAGLLLAARSSSRHLGGPELPGCSFLVRVPGSAL